MKSNDRASPFPARRMTRSEIGKLTICATAKYIGTIMVTDHVSDSRELAKITGLPLRTVQRAKVEFTTAADGAARATAGAPDAPVAPVVASADATSGAGPRARTQMENPSGLLCLYDGDDSPLTPQGEKRDAPLRLYNDHARVTLDGERIVLHNGLRQYWIDQFGGDEARLDLALTQAANYVQPSSRRPLETQVGSQLARIVAEKRDRDQRYEKAANAKQNLPVATGGGHMTNFDRKIEGGRRFRELAHATASEPIASKGART